MHLIYIMMQDYNLLSKNLTSFIQVVPVVLMSYLYDKALMVISHYFKFN